MTLATVHFQKPKWHEFCAPTLLFGVKSHQSFFFGVKPPQSLFFGVKSPQSLFFGVKSSQISFWWITVSIQNANANLHETHLSMYVLLYCFLCIYYIVIGLYVYIFINMKYLRTQQIKEKLPSYGNFQVEKLPSYGNFQVAKFPSYGNFQGRDTSKLWRHNSPVAMAELGKC